MKKYNFHSNLGKDECIRRFSDKTNPDRPYMPNGAIGKIEGDNFYFEIQFKAGWKGISTISKRFSGVFQSIGNGTNISGSLTSSGTNKFMIIIISIVALVIFVPWIIKNGANPYQIAFFAFALIAMYYIVPRSKGKENIEFIKNTFEAQEIAR